MCYLPEGLRIHHNEEHRSYWLVSDDGANFRRVRTQKKRLTPDQARVIDRYGMDSTTVYLNSEKVVGADPSSFEVIFPFGDDAKWDNFSFARDQRHLFIDGWMMPGVDLEGIAWLHVPCTEGTFRCSETSLHKANFGQLGEDVLFLQYGFRPTLFRRLARSELSCMRRDFTYFCIADGKRYRVEADFDEQARLVPVVSYATHDLMNE